ncbi:hypothetical protein [Sphingomonas sp. SUN039]|uniref:hypothetical protein n=1 Tax=Sphingomonas sp. SUN039 TaxID=2937787 RepID=UPI0021640B68|nr:hypothetical protein [Sphingomonas sp. SUN039]UVO55071.1 hypothetical protein M0209_13365 [Sphingomonas sp. SUN039]
MRAALGCGPALLLASCGAPESGPEVVLDRGMWKITTEFSTPKVDGLSVDDLRAKFPKNSEISECTQPVLAGGRALLRRLSLSGGCAIDSSTIENGVVKGAGLCDSIINQRAVKADKLETDNWLKIDGTYAPDYAKIEGDIVVTMTEDSGSTARFTAAVTHTAERTGDCK